MAQFDLVIRGGLIVDGSGEQPFVGELQAIAAGLFDAGQGG